MDLMFIHKNQMIVGVGLVIAWTARIEAQQPGVFPPYSYSVVNAASFSPAAASNGGIAQGSLFAIDGFSMGPDVLVQSRYPLTQNLAGTSVRVNIGSVLVPALIVSTSSSRVIALLPSSTPTGTGNLIVTFNGNSGPPLQLAVVSSSVGIITTGGNGLGPAAITGMDGTSKTLAAPAQPGEVVTLKGTGLLRRLVGAARRR